MIAVAVKSAVLSFLTAFLFSLLVIRICKRWQLFDRPGPLKIHLCPVPRLGGIAIVLAIGASAFLLLPVQAARHWPAFAALGLVWITSLIDDLRSLSASVRLLVQIGAALMLWIDGWRVPTASGWQGLSALSAMVTCVFVVAMINGFNFFDGSDGLAAGVAAISAIVYFTVLRQRADPFAAWIALSFFGACLGFLVTNAPPAKLFLGDSGSATLGLLIAFLGLDYWRLAPMTTGKMAFPLFVSALPPIDAALAIVRRLGNRESPLYGDRRHFYDLLLARKFSQRQVAFVCYAITAAFAALACWGARAESPTFWLVTGLCVLMLLVWALKLGALRGTIPNSSRRREIQESAISR